MNEACLPPLQWKWAEPPDTFEWRISTYKWLYCIFLECNEAANIYFRAVRFSANDSLTQLGIGEIEEDFATLNEAKDAIELWHRTRYADNQDEFDNWGGRDTEDYREFVAGQNCPCCGRILSAAE